MRILLTGCNGFLGTYLERKLSLSHEVFGCDLSHDDNPDHWRADISEYAEISRVFKGVQPDMVFNLAGEFGRKNGKYFPRKTWDTNCAGLTNVINLCLEFNAKLVHTSSSEAYGSLPSPQVEYELKTKVPTFANEYALTKWANLKQLEIASQYGLKYCSLLTFNSYGAGERYSPYRSVVCLFAYRLLKGLPITVYRGYERVFMHVTDWAESVSRIASRPWEPLNGQVINIGGKEVCSVERLKDKLLDLVGKTHSTIEYLDHEQANFTSKQPDISLARDLLGHDPKIGLDEGLPGVVDWMRKTYP